ncbi:MAG: M23 family metallopeptidase [Ignavibacteria bacterium]|jgi:murein DD-endopeptidase MepM/ murein hydrolase activator NlpD|nr:M23 family metallopeptidase [Ignavibacteria bacterium]MDH7526759.1 M23 family metallopeptidase [Ignavibacteria bacterium]NPV11596.1 M23 family metallopeptidase [Ignavibacteria bacterium]
MMKILKKIFRFDYELLLVPKDATKNLKTYRFNSVKALLLILLVLVFSNLALVLLITYTPLGKILPDSPYLSKEDYGQIVELREKVLALSREVDRVQKINERLQYIIEGKPIPIDPRDLDTNYQIERMRRDSLRILGKSRLSNNLYFIFLRFLQAFQEEQSKNSNSEKNKNEMLFFIKPAEGLVTRGFNKEISHYGIDFGMPIGSIVRASASGIVVFADYTINDGYKIILSHSKGYITVYKHLSQILKKERDFVKQGDIIGLSGNTGKLTTGPHLHFEIWKYQTPLDPQKILVDLK